MKNIKAIAFDLGGVFTQENEYPLSEIEQLLEKQFGKINTNEAYYTWATKTTQLPQEEIEKITEDIIENIYDLREYEIFDHLPKVKLAIASNHLSAIHKRIDNMEIQSRFNCILISGDIDIEKPNKEFYEKLAEELHEQPENILFIDDDKENIEAAKKLGFSVLHYYDHSKSLTQEILNKLKQI